VEASNTRILSGCFLDLNEGVLVAHKPWFLQTFFILFTGCGSGGVESFEGMFVYSFV